MLLVVACYSLPLFPAGPCLQFGGLCVVVCLDHARLPSGSAHATTTNAATATAPVAGQDGGQHVDDTASVWGLCVSDRGAELE